MPKITANNRWARRNNRLRAENDFNRVMREYVTYKYGPIAEECCRFYDQLKDKYPTKSFYKGSTQFRTWVGKQIEEYVASGNDSTDSSDSHNNEEQVPTEQAPREQPETLEDLVNELLVGEDRELAHEQQQQREQQQQAQLDELDNIVGQIIADIEANNDEGISLDLGQDLLCDSDIDFDIDVEEKTEQQLDQELCEWW